MAPIPDTSNLVLPGFSLFAFAIFCSVLTVACLVAIFGFWGYKRYRFTKTSDNVDIESKSPSIVTIPIPELPSSADWVEFVHEGKTYRYTKYQAQALLSIILTSTSPDSPTKTAEDHSGSSLPSLDSDEGSNDSSNDNLGVYGTRMDGLCSPPTCLDIPKSMELDLQGADVPDIWIHECEDPEPTDNDFKDTCLSTSLSAPHLDTDFLSERSC
ncbi:hypothetical protein NLI96_g3891 [Meripilus lineatus]|uniref:Uncharacterized protein n=1 Tax=Meripilus lineatus TaxID=2056292 RepID=A0AAD5V822_9APHY|nr:hypothetical protein NLI96_g3891 [Physisporinus lineatus]